MSRTPFDSFSKQFLEELLSPFGEVNLNREVEGESQFVDVFFVPNPHSSDEGLQDLGLLGRMAASVCLIEPFRNPPSPDELRACLLKLFAIQADLLRRAKRDKVVRSQLKLPQLWILAPSLSQEVLMSFGATLPDQDISGLYPLPSGFLAAVLVIHQLPIRSETLWIRLLGRGKVQNRAITEILALPKEDLRRSKTLQLLASWKITLDLSGIMETEDRELVMALSQAYLEWEQKTLEQGVQQGSQQEARSLVLKQLSRKFGVIPLEITSLIDSLSLSQLETLGEDLLDFAAIADLNIWLQSHQA